MSKKVQLLIKMYYMFDYIPGIYPNWTMLSSSLPPENKFTLIIGGLAAHIVMLENWGSGQFETRLESYLKHLRMMILDSRKWQTKGVVRITITSDNKHSNVCNFLVD